MPTPAERKALLFLGAVALLGAGVRGWRATRGVPPLDSALAAQRGAVDSARRSKKRGAVRKRSRRKDTLATGVTVDLDTASVQTIARIPRVSAAVAQLIVSDRDSLGPFGSLEALARVPGLTRATRTRLAGRVTFSRLPRPSNTVIARPQPIQGRRKPRPRDAPP